MKKKHKARSHWSGDSLAVQFGAHHNESCRMFNSEIEHSALLLQCTTNVFTHSSTPARPYTTSEHYPTLRKHMPFISAALGKHMPSTSATLGKHMPSTSATQSFAHSDMAFELTSVLLSSRQMSRCQSLAFFTGYIGSGLKATFMHAYWSLDIRCTSAMQTSRRKGTERKENLMLGRSHVYWPATKKMI